MTLQEIRAEIDRIDQQIVDLLNRRARLSVEVGQLKREQAGPGQEPMVYQPEREVQVFANVIAANQGPLPNRALESIYREILSSSRALQRRLKVGYLGPVGTFAFEAARVQFGSDATYVPCRTIADVFAEAEKQTVDFGVVPVENSTEGAVNHTIDRFLETDLRICAEIALPVSHFLLSRGSLDTITQVYSHPQALAQCRRWLAEHLPHATQVQTASTALAAQMATDPNTAAISPEAASEVYNLPIIARHIEDVSTNVTRFLVIGPQQAARSGRDRTAIVFGVHDRTGALFTALKSLAENDINLTHIESRPSRRRLWEYVFFVDLDGHPDDERVRVALDQLRNGCTFVRVLGAWPVSATGAPVP